VDAEREYPAPGEGVQVPTRAAAHIEHGAGQTAQQAFVGRVGGVEVAVELQRLDRAVAEPDRRRSWLAGAEQALAVHDDGVCHQIAASADANRVAGASRATACASSIVSTSRRGAGSWARRPSAFIG